MEPNTKEGQGVDQIDEHLLSKREATMGSASWTMQKILQAGYWLDEAGIQKEIITTTSTFSIKEVYRLLRGQYDNVP